MIDQLWVVIALPLAGAALLLLFGKRIGDPWSGWIATAAVAGSFCLAVPLAVRFLQGGAEAETIDLFTWIPVIGAEASLLWDPLSALMVLVVTGIGSLIHLYAIGYMRGDERFGRFFAFLNLFAASMLILVLGANFAVLFVGWELVGMCSYLLISFWFTRPSAAAAGKKAFVVNRIGDWGFLVALMLVFAVFGTLDFGVVFEEAPVVLTTGTATAITLLLFVGAAGKSAQIPLYVWLPDAMEGPTPVSALIHAATMVTAGVYMVARTAPLYDLAPFSAGVVATVGALTALLAATIAVAQRDIKRVLAYSTISQLGYMVLAVGVAAYTAGIFHLMTHAFFKALLFLGAGSVIHAMADEQDMRRMGGLRRLLPVTFATMAVAWLAISGVPPLAGFWSKDEILAAVFGAGGWHLVLWVMGVATGLLTAFYMTRLMVMTFWGERRWADSSHPHEAPPVMLAPLVLLAIGSALAGFVNTPWRLGLEHFLEPAFEGVAHATTPEGATAAILIALSVVVAVTGIAVAWRRYAESLPEESGGYWDTALVGYRVDDWYGRLVVAPGLAMATWWAKVLDLGVVDGIVDGVGSTVRRLADALRPLQSGLVRSYAVGIAFGALGLVVLILFGGGAF